MENATKVFCIEGVKGLKKSAIAEDEKFLFSSDFEGVIYTLFL